MKRVTLIILCNMMLVTAAWSAPQSEKGLFFAMGAGVAVTHTGFDRVDSSWNTGESETHAGVAAAFKLGYGIRPDLDLYITRTSAFVHGYDNDTKSRTYGNCITAIGVNYYFDDTQPWYLLGALGQGQLSNLEEDESQAQKGVGFLLGVGYELYKNVHFEVSYMGTRVDDTYKVQSDVLHTALSIYLY